MTAGIQHPAWCSPACLVEPDSVGGELTGPHLGPAHLVPVIEPTKIPPEELSARLYRWPVGTLRIEMAVDGRPLLLTPAT